MKAVYHKDLWTVLREAIGYNRKGNCRHWSRLAYKVLNGESDSSLDWIKSEVIILKRFLGRDKREVHHFLRCEVPIGNIVTVDGTGLERMLRHHKARLGVENIVRTTGFLVQGHVMGTPGLVAVLDGTADQSELSDAIKNHDTVKGGFYGAIELAPDGFRSCYSGGSIYDYKE